MDILQAIEQRHSVRSYLDTPIPAEAVTALMQEIHSCNMEHDTHIQLVTNEPKAFDGMMAHYGKFSGVRNYIALIGKKGPQLDQTLGYLGERIALKAQMLGLNTCWVAMSFSKGTVKKGCTINKGEKLVCVLSLGYGATQGVPHKSKTMEQVTEGSQMLEPWFAHAMEAVLLAPTAMNQQKFLFSCDGDKVSAKSTGGFYSQVDLGIAKYHFEVGCDGYPFRWK